MMKKTFEQALQQLEQIVNEMEKGDLPIEKALKKFEDGMALSKFCAEKLDETEQRILLLLKNQDGTVREVPFSQGPNPSGGDDPEL
ncbi:MAG: exodeoxyribonuclease VII small subunit [Thermodesulfobacteriota bacterium]